MQRVLVIGPCGAGKSFLSRRLGVALKLPVVHLDAEYWRPGWVEPDRDQWDRLVEKLIAKQAWIIDGSYHSTLPQRLRRADTVILLDFPTWICFGRTLMRIATTYGRVRSDVGAGCPEQLDPSFLKYVLRYRRNHLPRVLAELRQFTGTIVTLKTRGDVNRFMDSLRPHTIFDKGTQSQI